MMINGKDNGMSYKDTMRLEFDKLEKAINLKDYLVTGKLISDIISEIEKDNEGLDLLDCVTESEFMEYITEKYNKKFCEVVSVDFYLK